MIRRSLRSMLAVPAVAIAATVGFANTASAAAEGASASVEWECTEGYLSVRATITNDSDSAYPYQFVVGAASTDGTVSANDIVTPEIGLITSLVSSASISVTVDGVLLYSNTITVNCDPDPDASATIEVFCPRADEDNDIAVIYTFTTAGKDTFEYLTPDGTEASETVSINSVSTGNKVSEGDEIDVWVKIGDTELARLTTTVDCDGSGSGGAIPDAGATDTIPLVATTVLLAGLLITGGLSLARRRQPVA